MLFHAVNMQFLMKPSGWMMLLLYFQCHFEFNFLQPNPQLHDVGLVESTARFRISVVNTDVVPEAKLEEAVTPNAEAAIGKTC